MNSRVVTKVGDIYRTAEDRLLQLVAIDPVQLNSDVVVVYKTQELAAIDFYHHTTVSDGVRQQLWEKVGNAPTPNLPRMKFKTYFDEYESEIINSSPEAKPYWRVWELNGSEPEEVSEEAGARMVAEDGSVVPAQDIIYRIKNGASSFKLNWPL